MDENQFTERRAAFRAMHASGCFVLPNAWDAGSAKRIEALGFRAVASTSIGLAWSKGREDYELSLDEVLAHLRELCRATSLPVNADFENGFAEKPEDVARNVALAIDAGVAGLSVEDRNGDAVFPPGLAAERIAAARDAIRASGQDVVLVARAEGLVMGIRSLDDTVERLKAFALAGADCLYALGLASLADVATVVRAVDPKPVNVILGPFAVSDLAATGVRRVSLGGALARAAWGGFGELASALARADRELVS